MWCSTCQQETPGIAHATTGRIVCSRCQQPVRKQKAANAALICDDGIALDEQPAKVAASASAPSIDWPTERRVRTLARELNRPTAAVKKAISGVVSDRRRFEPPHDLFSQPFEASPHTAAATITEPATIAPLKTLRSEGSQALAWLTVTVGTLTLASGLGLVGWSLSTTELHYWNLGLCLALGGQGTLILGLVLVVSRLWRHSRFAAHKLQTVQAHLGQLQQTAEILTTMRSNGGAPAFYAELARGASPHVLLTNLKGQLDQLATRLGNGF